MTAPATTDWAMAVWRALGTDEESFDPVDPPTIIGPATVLPAAFDVTGFAVATTAPALLAAAQLLGTRRAEVARPVTLSTRSAAAAFLAERLFTPLGWDLPPTWDPIAGDYRTQDGWIRLHTNYPHHRAVVHRVLGAETREDVTRAVASWEGTALEDAIVSAGGCAAVMHTRAQWLGSAAGRSTRDEPLARTDVGTPTGSAPRWVARSPVPVRPFDGVRVLDLTRVLAGPMCTRFLAAYGADVLRIDPVGVDEVAALVPETTAGKHSTRLDLTGSADRTIFADLVRTADVLVSGYRPGALAALGYDASTLHSLNPELITASLDAYGWTGPWRERRGFDSLVQMSVGIASAGASADGTGAPRPLPAQALDHGTGAVLAAAIGRALLRQLRHGAPTSVRCSLVGTATALLDHPSPSGRTAEDPQWSDADLVTTRTAWGPVRHVPLPGEIAGTPPHWTVDAGPIGRHAPVWST